MYFEKADEDLWRNREGDVSPPVRSSMLLF